jgi:hypothetical protein
MLHNDDEKLASFHETENTCFIVTKTQLRVVSVYLFNRIVIEIRHVNHLCHYMRNCNMCTGNVFSIELVDLGRLYVRNSIVSAIKLKDS